MSKQHTALAMDPTHTRTNALALVKANDGTLGMLVQLWIPRDADTHDAEWRPVEMIEEIDAGIVAAVAVPVVKRSHHKAKSDDDAPAV